MLGMIREERGNTAKEIQELSCMDQQELGLHVWDWILRVLDQEGFWGQLLKNDGWEEHGIDATD